MSTRLDDTTSDTSRRGRDLFAVAFLVLGLGLVHTAAWLTDLRLALAVAGATLMGIGLLAGVDRDDTR